MTLVCHHPEVVTNRSRYFSPIPTWTEDGVVFAIADGTIYTGETVADLTRSFLNITITVDHFRNKSFKYSCELLLAGEKGRPSGDVETSGEVTVDPVGELLVHKHVYTCTVITSSDCHRTFIQLQYLIFEVVYHHSLIHMQRCG